MENLITWKNDWKSRRAFREVDKRLLLSKDKNSFIAKDPQKTNKSERVSKDLN
ncbi:MAG: hypothetical protein RXO36_06510 [Candidatus Nanopusillus acidilobi]